MISSEVQRTLVKSPPELWAELSDPAALARHLGELGEIRITRTEPEKTVEWEAENTTGTVSIRASGWGTRVTLSVTRELVGGPAAADTADAQLGADVETRPTVEPSATVEITVPAEPSAAVETDDDDENAVKTPAEPATEAITQTETPATLAAEPTSSEPRSDVAAESEPTADQRTPLSPTVSEPAPQQRRGFFARLFGRRRKTGTAEPQPSQNASASSRPEPAEELTPVGGAAPNEPLPTTATEQAPPAMADESADAFAAVREALAPDSVATIDLVAVVPATQPGPRDAPIVPTSALEPEPQPEQTGDIAAELRAAEEFAAEEVTAVLAAVLDRLGAAHHRPFSRS